MVRNGQTNTNPTSSSHGEQLQPKDSGKTMQKVRPGVNVLERYKVTYIVCNTYCSYLYRNKWEYNINHSAVCKPSSEKRATVLSLICTSTSLATGKAVSESQRGSAQLGTNFTSESVNENPWRLLIWSGKQLKRSNQARTCRDRTSRLS